VGDVSGLEARRRAIAYFWSIVLLESGCRMLEISSLFCRIGSSSRAERSKRSIDPILS